PSGLATVASWIHDGGQAGGEFGAYAISARDVNADGYGDVIIGAFRTDHPSRDEGMAFLFLGSSAGLANTAAWSAEGDQADAELGYHVDGCGDVDGDGYGDVIVSASGYDVGALTDAGQAYFYRGTPAGLASTPAWVQPGDQTGAGIDAVRGVGDV